MNIIRELMGRDWSRGLGDGHGGVRIGGGGQGGRAYGPGAVPGKGGSGSVFINGVKVADGESAGDDEVRHD